jgi:hypothetical protein
MTDLSRLSRALSRKDKVSDRWPEASAPAVHSTDRVLLPGQVDPARAARLVAESERRRRRRKFAPAAWTPGLVRERLLEARRLIDRMAIPWKPRGHKNTMPAYRHDANDAWANWLEWSQTDSAFARDRNRVAFAASADQVSRLEEAIGWPARYLADAGLRRLLGAFLDAKARRKGLRRLCRERGWSYSLFERRVGQACGLIAAGLKRDRVPVRAAE